jgi:hypothetical protein
MFLRAFCRSASLLALTATPALADCAAVGAVYRLATDPEGKQGEIRIVRDQGLTAGTVMVLSLPGYPDTRLEMIQSQGYGSTSVWVQPGVVLPESDDAMPLAVFEDGPNGRLFPYSDWLPLPDSVAPDAFLIPGLGPALWYDTADRIEIDRSIWYLHACGP